MQRHRRWPALLFGTALILGLIPGAAWADGLKMENYTEVLVENLQIGSEYSMVKLVNLPLKIINVSDEPIHVALELIVPGEERLKAGFEPIPDTAWINLGNSVVAIAGNSTYLSDVKVLIPDKREYLGKKYEVDIRARILPQGGFLSIAMAVQGRMLIGVAPVKDARASKKVAANLAYSMTPDRVELAEVPLGTKIEVLADGKPVFVKNEGKSNQVFTLASLDSSRISLRLDPGSEPAPSPEFLTFSEEEFKINSNQEKPIQMFLELPDQPEFRGKKYQFVVSVKAGADGNVGRYMRVMVNTAQ